MNNHEAEAWNDEDAAWNDEGASWNEEIAEDLEPQGLDSLVVYSRDWTVETIISQISNGNIDLNPKFQRRNAWTDIKRSKLIESLIIGVPVPEIVFAEDPKRKRSFITIDGKQRLLTIAGYVQPEKYQYWNNPKLKHLTVREDLNGSYYEHPVQGALDDNDLRTFLNADIRCTVLSNYQSDDVLYDVFYRLNTGSVPLSTQELRQVLNKGPFADYLIEVTNEPQPIHKVLRLEEPDPRLRDVEIILRFLSFTLFGDRYEGNLKRFLDDSMKTITESWGRYEGEVRRLYESFNESVNKLLDVFSPPHAGRKFTDGRWEGRFNKALFEVEVYYFMFVDDSVITSATKEAFLEGFQKLNDTNVDFRSSIEATTKTVERYETRFSLFRDLVNDAFGTRIEQLPVKE